MLLEDLIVILFSLILIVILIEPSANVKFCICHRNEPWNHVAWNELEAQSSSLDELGLLIDPKFLDARLVFVPSQNESFVQGQNRALEAGHRDQALVLDVKDSNHLGHFVLLECQQVDFLVLGCWIYCMHKCVQGFAIHLETLTLEHWKCRSTCLETLVV